MDIIQLCPNCGSIGVAVNNTTVKNIILQKHKNQVLNDEQWFICPHFDCKIVYFTEEGSSFKQNDVNVKIWYKDSSDNTPICYCSDLTRGEIINAVKNGCKTIDSVQKYTNKNITGKCLRKNPLGKCCRNVFLRVIKDAD